MEQKLYILTEFELKALDRDGYFDCIREYLVKYQTLRCAWEELENLRMSIGVNERYASYRSFFSAWKKHLKSKQKLLQS